MALVQERISRAIQQRHVSISTREFLDILVEASGTSEPLTEGEQAFLVEHAGVTRDQFTIEAGTLTNVRVTQMKAVADHEARTRSLMTSEVADLLGQEPSNVRRSLGAGRLYSVGSASRGRERLFPEWQFTQDGRVLPGLREVLAALPDNYHPLDVEHFMVGESEALRGRSPASWLAGGGEVQAVVEIAVELSRA